MYNKWTIFTFQLNFVGCELLALGLAFGFRHYLHPNIVSPTVRHVVSVVTGFIFGFFCFGRYVVFKSEEVKVQSSSYPKTFWASLDIWGSLLDIWLNFMQLFTGHFENSLDMSGLSGEPESLFITTIKWTNIRSLDNTLLYYLDSRPPDTIPVWT